MFNQRRKIEYEKLERNDSYGTLALNIWDVPEKKDCVQEREVVERTSIISKNRFSWHVRRNHDNLPVVRGISEPLVVPELINEKGRRKRFSAKTNMVKAHALVTIAVIIMANLGCVIVNHMIMNTQMNLVTLQRTERDLLRANSELKIAVEELKGPERIREIAIKDLKMMVARENVYVRASQTTSIREIYGKAANDLENNIYAMIEE